MPGGALESATRAAGLGEAQVGFNDATGDVRAMVAGPVDRAPANVPARHDDRVRLQPRRSLTISTPTERAKRSAPGLSTSIINLYHHLLPGYQQQMKL